MEIIIACTAFAVILVIPSFMILDAFDKISKLKNEIEKLKKFTDKRLKDIEDLTKYNDAAICKWNDILTNFIAKQEKYGRNAHLVDMKIREIIADKFREERHKIKQEVQHGKSKTDTNI